MLESRSLETHPSLCPAAYQLAETPAGSGVLCRVTGRVVATGTDPSSLAAYCWSPVANAQGPGANGEPVGIGYQNCVVWRHNRKRELEEKDDLLPADAPQRVRQALAPEFITRA